MSPVNRRGKSNDMLRYCVEQPGNAQTEDLIATNIYSSVGSEDEMSAIPQKADSGDSAESRNSILHLDEQHSKPARARPSALCERSCDCKPFDKR